MATHAELVAVFGSDGVMTLDRADVESYEVRADVAEVLCSVGIPVAADMLFSMQVDGPYEALTMFQAETQDRPARFLILGKGGRGDEVAGADQIRYAVELGSGNVFMLAIEDGELTSDIETINTTLGSFVECLYRIELRRREMAGASAEEARPYTEKVIAELRELDERALSEEAFWGGVFEALLKSGVPKIGEGSRGAIAAAVEALVPGQPLRWSTETAVGKGVQELSAHAGDGYWLLVTWGFSDLDGQLEAVAGLSGLGFELTMRVPRTDDDEMPPGWALQTLRKLGEYVFGEGYAFADGHRMGVAGKLGPESSRLDALAFVTDPELGAIDTPGGRIEFITAVGVTREELAEAKATSNDEVLAQLSVITDVSR
ncbi:suppressor of fused domain protein [Actinomadura barringtoniae]|uniref:Suppressor of fused domain protein n=1 Tax=Actinomadura barringtoniae TaxID=1427535 RepID=A0A939PEJ5_9ACTN|nr:suppressor of fused domain protein [Actinomadura barringtoniae]MBO2448244.1 suppressor of fused domain protein [Actinomadura barringtoniae]